MRRLAIAAAVLAPALAAAAPRGVLAQRRSGGGHSRSRGAGVPCGRSYISADKVCHIGTAGTSASGASSGAVAPDEGAVVRALDFATASPARDSALAARCAADSAASALRGVGREPICLRLGLRRPPPAPAPPVPVDVDLLARAWQDQHVVAPRAAALRRSAYDTAEVLALIPRGRVVDVSSCVTDGGAWCFASVAGHGGFVRRDTRADGSAPSIATGTERFTRASTPRGAGARSHAAASPAVRGSAHPGYYVGPRGGCYTYSASGRKRYVDHSYCR